MSTAPRRRRLSTLILAVVFLLLAGAGLAVVFTERSIEGSAPGNSPVLSLAVTPDGYLVGTETGVLGTRDGKRWGVHQRLDDPSIVTSAAGTAWAMVGSAVYRFEDLTAASLIGELEGRAITLAAGKEGLLVLTASEGSETKARGHEGVQIELLAAEGGPQDAMAMSLSGELAGPSRRVYAAGAGSGVWLLETAAGGWQRILETPSTAVLVDPDDPDRVLLGTAGGVLVSKDAGRSWEFGGFREEVSALSAHDGTFFAVSVRLIYKSPDGISKWEALARSE